LSVGGTATFAASAANDITLDNADDFNTVAITSANNVTLNDVNALNLGASDSVGWPPCNGEWRDHRQCAVSVGGTATFAAGAGHDITLDNADDFNAMVIRLEGRDLNDVNASIGSFDYIGNFEVSADGAITDSGAYRSMARLRLRRDRQQHHPR